MKEMLLKILEYLLLKSNGFKYWWKGQLGRDLFDLDLSEEMLSRGEIRDRKYKQHEKLRKLLKLK